jgi:GNAT superfamily N-acetyltransferase
MSSFADRARAGIARLAPGDHDDWIRFQARSHGHLARQANAEWLAWQTTNPELEGTEPQAWICRRDGKIVGSQGGIRFRLKEGDQTVPAAWAVDLMVDPEWRMRGVGPALVDAQIREGGLVAAIGVSDAAYRAYLRGGWRDMGGIPRYIRPRDVAWNVREAGLRGWRLAAARVGLHIALAATRAFSGTVTRVMGAQLRPVPRFDARVNEVWAQAARSYDVIAVRDGRSLAWRFDAVPGAGRISRHYVVHRGRVRGYVVTRIDGWRGGRVLEILDYLAAPRWVLPMLAHVTRLADSADVVAITCRTLSPPCDRAFRVAGYIQVSASDTAGPLSYRSAGQTRFMVHRPDQSDRLAYHADRWFVTAADSDGAFEPSQPVVPCSRAGRDVG